MTKKVKDSQILRRVQMRIRSHRDTFICHAIMSANMGTITQRESLRNWVMHMLNGCGTYSVWVAKHHPMKYIEMRKVWKHNYDPFAAGRVQWLDWMIAQCEKKERLK